MQGAIRDYNKIAKALIFIGLVVMIGGVFTYIGKLIAEFIYDITIGNNKVIDLNQNNIVQGLRIMQIFAAVGTFIVPSVLFVRLNGGELRKALKLTNTIDLKAVLYTLASVFAISPFVFWVHEWNQGIELPASLDAVEQIMRESEAQAERMLQAFLGLNSLPDFLLNLVMVGVCAAVGEEFLFRGILQQKLIKYTKNVHVGVWVAAFIFSAIHMQFYGFVPRMLLGALFGYVFVFSGSLWIPIIAHFLHNSSQLTMMYMYNNGWINTNIDNIETIPVFVAMASLIAGLSILFVFKQRSEGKESVNE